MALTFATTDNEWTTASSTPPSLFAPHTSFHVAGSESHYADPDHERRHVTCVTSGNRRSSLDNNADGETDFRVDTVEDQAAYKTADGVANCLTCKGEGHGLSVSLQQFFHVDDCCAKQGIGKSLKTVNASSSAYWSY